MAKNINNLDKSLKQNITPADIGAATSSSVTTVSNNIGTLSNLKTSAKGNLVAAINELFQSANSGKQLIANAIGNPSITGNSTFSAMSEAIEELSDKADSLDSARNTLAGLMQEGGYDITGNENIDSLLDLLVISGISVSDIKQIAGGVQYTIILKTDGSLWSCGNNSYGQLGLGDTNTRYIFTQVTYNINNDVKQISCGESFTFILKNDGSLWSTGRNYYGQLGLGVVNSTETPDRNTFTQVTININNDVKQVVCGGYHTFIIKTDGSLWACGYNYYGNLGFNDSTERQKFTKVTTNINNDVKQIACGYTYTFIIKNDGSLWSCGNNANGSLGLNSTTNQKTFTQVTTNINNDVKQIVCGGYHNFILKNDGSIWSCGYNANGALGLNDTTIRKTFTQVTTNINNDVKQIACGDFHTIILKNDGSVWSCGYNNVGQLGLNDSANKSTFTQVTYNVNNDVKQIACGDNHNFILKNDGSIWSCGYNNYGQLGLGNNTNNRYTFTIMPRGL